MNGFLEDVYITERMPKDKALQWQRNANLMLMMGHERIIGISSSKLYEYIGLRKKVLLVCNDHDIMERILKDTGLGVVCDATEEIVQLLTDEIDHFIKNPERKFHYNEAAVALYSRKSQVRKLAEILDNMALLLINKC